MDSNNPSHCIRSALSDNIDPRVLHQCNHNDKSIHDNNLTIIKSDVKYQERQTSNSLNCDICDKEVRKKSTKHPCISCNRFCHSKCLGNTSLLGTVYDGPLSYVCKKCTEYEFHLCHNDINCPSCNEEHNVVHDMNKMCDYLFIDLKIDVEKIKKINIFDTNDNMLDETDEYKKCVFLKIFIIRLERIIFNFRGHLIRVKGIRQTEIYHCNNLNVKTGMKIYLYEYICMYICMYVYIVIFKK